MSKPKAKRNKKYVPRREGDRKLKSMPWKVHTAMQPFDEFMSELENRGTVTVSAKGVPICVDALYQDVYPLCAAALGFIECFEIYERKRNVDLGLLPLKQLIKRVEYGSVVTEKELYPAKQTLENIRKVMYEMTVDEAIELCKDGQIKVKLEGLS